MPRSPGQVADHERHHDPETGGGNSVQRLHDHHQLRIRDQGEQQPAHRQRGEGQHENDPAAAGLRDPADRGRE